VSTDSDSDSDECLHCGEDLWGGGCGVAEMSYCDDCYLLSGWFEIGLPSFKDKRKRRRMSENIKRRAVHTHNF